jgi:Na+-transporting methylmalonyl-CoA/oxaloacetate decarboxylase gamma subunit
MNKLFKSLKSLFILISLGAISGNVVAQSASDLRINEILVKNVNNYEDDFGIRSSWIEIFNSAYNTVNIAGCYLTNDPNNPKKYRIPKGDPITKITSRGYIVFWADNKTTHGTLHLNFDLSKSNYLALYDQSGRVLIDSVTFSNAAQKVDTSWARTVDGDALWNFNGKPTPNGNNDTAERATAGATFLFFDPYGGTMAFISMSVVFLALILLYLSFKYIGKANIRQAQKAKQKDMEKQGITAKTMDGEDASGETLAAIAIALHLLETDKQDLENTILTIEKTSRTYSPWSSKIYGMRQTPQKLFYKR